MGSALSALSALSGIFSSFSSASSSRKRKRTEDIFCDSDDEPSLSPPPHHPSTSPNILISWTSEGATVWDEQSVVHLAVLGVVGGSKESRHKRRRIDPQRYCREVIKGVRLVAGRKEGGFGGSFRSGVLPLKFEDGEEEEVLSDRAVAAAYCLASGYHIADAAKFGADFLLYEANPATHHATHLLIVCKTVPSVTAVCGWTRLAQSVNKSLLLFHIVQIRGGGGGGERGGKGEGEEVQMCLPTMATPGRNDVMMGRLEAYLRKQNAGVEVLRIAYTRGVEVAG